jgi:hypothetical protein
MKTARITERRERAKTAMPEKAAILPKMARLAGRCGAC